jgi:hypothetical protein
MFNHFVNLVLIHLDYGAQMLNALTYKPVLLNVTSTTITRSSINLVPAATTTTASTNSSLPTSSSYRTSQVN